MRLFSRDKIEEMCHYTPVHLPTFSRCFIGLCCLTILLAAGPATVHAENSTGFRPARLIYSFSGRVRSIEDPRGELAAYPHFTTGQVVSASFLVDEWIGRGFQINNDGRLRTINGYRDYQEYLRQTVVLEPFYCRLISEPPMPKLYTGGPSYPDAVRHYLHGDFFAIYTNVFAPPTTNRTILKGGSSASSLAIMHSGVIESWSEGLEVTGVASADTDGRPTAIIDMRLDSITPTTNLHAPEPVISVPQASNIPGLIDSTNNTYFILGGRAPNNRVRLNVSPSIDGDGDPVYFGWSAWANNWSFETVAHGEAPIINFYTFRYVSIRLDAFDGDLTVSRGLSITIYTPAQATDLMRRAVRALPGSSSAKTTALALLQNASSSFQRADWRRGLQFLQAFEQLMARSAYTIPSSKRTPFIDLSRAIRRAVSQPVTSTPHSAIGNSWSSGGSSGVISQNFAP